MQEESRKEKNFIKRIYHAEAPKWLKYVILFGYPILLFYITAFMTYNPFVRTRWRAQILNLLLFEAFVWLLLAITGSAVIALRNSWNCTEHCELLCHFFPWFSGGSVGFTVSWNGSQCCRRL